MRPEPSALTRQRCVILRSAFQSASDLTNTICRLFGESCGSLICGRLIISNRAIGRCVCASNAHALTAQSETPAPKLRLNNCIRVPFAAFARRDLFLQILLV